MSGPHYPDSKTITVEIELIGGFGEFFVKAHARRATAVGHGESNGSERAAVRRALRALRKVERCRQRCQCGER